MYSGKVLRSESLDPTYTVKFSYSEGNFNINDGTAFFVRHSPFPKVSFDDYTDYLIERNQIDTSVLQNLKLEIGKTVCDYIFSTMELKSI